MLRLWPILILLAALGCRSAAPRAATRPTAQPAPEPSTPLAAPAWTSIGRSHQDRSLLATTIGSGPLRIYLIAGIHGNETEGLAVLDDLITALARAEPPATIRILRDANPDGTAARTRGNARGRDLNRNWPAANFRSRSGSTPLSEPETETLHADLSRTAPALVIVFHSAAGGPFVNFDGPASHLARAFADAASRAGPRWRVVPDMGYPTPGSLGSYLGVDRRIPILTIELRRAQDPASCLAGAVAGIDAAIRAAAASGPFTAPAP